jgi:hypothetical protein
MPSLRAFRSADQVLVNPKSEFKIRSPEILRGEISQITQITGGLDRD